MPVFLKLENDTTTSHHIFIQIPSNSVITDMPTNPCIVWISTWVLFLRVYVLDFSNNTGFVKTSFSEAIRSGWPFIQECYESCYLSHLVSTSRPSTFHLNEWWMDVITDSAACWKAAAVQEVMIGSEPGFHLQILKLTALQVQCQ